MRSSGVRPDSLRSCSWPSSGSTQFSLAWRKPSVFWMLLALAVDDDAGQAVVVLARRCGRRRNDLRLLHVAVGGHHEELVGRVGTGRAHPPLVAGRLGPPDVVDVRLGDRGGHRVSSLSVMMKWVGSEVRGPTLPWPAGVQGAPVEASAADRTPASAVQCSTTANLPRRPHLT